MGIALLLATVLAAGVPEGVKEYCAEDWPNDYSMQEFCVDQQTEAALKLKAVIERYQGAPNSPEYRALGKCVEDWEKGTSYDFTMVEFCWNQQVEAMNRLRNK